MGIIQSFQGTINLLKNTFVVIGKNPAILRPTITQIILLSGFFVILLASILALFFAKSGIVIFIAIILIVLSVLFLLILFPFVKMYYRAAQCWIVYHTFTGNNISYKEGLSRARQNKLDIFILGLWDILFNALAKTIENSSKKQRSGFLGFILNILLWLLAKTIEEGWDLAGNYLLPASIIKEQNVGQALDELKNIRSNVPAALTGVFGFDFVGNALKSSLIWLGILFIAFGFVVFFLNYSLTPLLVLIMLWIGIYLTVGIFVDMIKTIYFTLFYVEITMPMEVVPGFKEEVTNYLKYQTGFKRS